MNIPYAFNRGITNGAYLGAALSIAMIASAPIATAVAPVIGMSAIFTGASMALPAMVLGFTALTAAGAVLGAATFTTTHIVVNAVPGLRDALREPDYTTRKPKLRHQVKEYHHSVENEVVEDRSFNNDNRTLAGEYHLQIVRDGEAQEQAMSR